ncbi:MAG: GlcNAc-PI de-N-acetylase [Actinobacteria bacterium]|nr:GlcNAc-PI de-N-acetylase [Actinomycetota bacterium]
MGTLVTFHAHPDDEAIATGGSMRLAADAGHRVVLVVATRGECGEVADGVLDPDETLGQRREAEQRVSAAMLGVDRVEFLGYHDSGMVDEPSNDNPTCFWQADVEEAAARLAAILANEDVDVLTCYDSHGGYGHPDHIQVHRVGHRAAELAGVERVYESTMNRTRIAELRAAAAAIAAEAGDDELDMPDVSQDDTFGSPDEIITTAVDVSSVVAIKRRAMAAHASQIDDSSFFMQMPHEMFAVAFGTEWFIRADSQVDGRETWLFDEPAPPA